MKLQQCKELLHNREIKNGISITVPKLMAKHAIFLFIYDNYPKYVSKSEISDALVIPTSTVSDDVLSLESDGLILRYVQDKTGWQLLKKDEKNTTKRVYLFPKLDAKCFKEATIYSLKNNVFNDYQITPYFIEFSQKYGTEMWHKLLSKTFRINIINFGDLGKFPRTGIGEKLFLTKNGELKCVPKDYSEQNEIDKPLPDNELFQARSEKTLRLAESSTLQDVFNFQKDELYSICRNVIPTQILQNFHEIFINMFFNEKHKQTRRESKESQ